jgi:hypothetical protein
VREQVVHVLGCFVHHQEAFVKHSRRAIASTLGVL